MTSHKDKGILDMAYNFLNLPNRITFDQTYLVRNIFSGTTETRNITSSYFFRSNGEKLRKVYAYGIGKNQSETFTITEYLDGFQYEGFGSSLRVARTLKFVPTVEGYYNFENNKYIYNYTDHLGNVRLSYYNNGSSIAVLEENNYYPFGMKHEGYNGLAGNTSYQYKYNGKELQTESGMYDYGARFYMPDVGRWGVIDPLAEKMTKHSPYSYAFNNPVIFIDPDGMEPVGDYYNKLGKYLGSDGKNDNKVYVADNRNSDGSFSNAKELNTTHSQFQIMSNIIKAESSGNPMESLMLAHVANNAVGDKDVNYKGNEGLYQMLTDGNYSTTSSSDRTTPLSTGNGSDAANGARSAVISVLTGGKDPTGGAVLWDGIDFLKKGMDHNKFKEYSYISISSNVLGNFIRNAETNYNKVNPNWSLNSVFRSSSINPATGKCGPWCYTTSRWTGVGNSKRPFELQGTSSAGMSIFWKVKK